MRALAIGLAMASLAVASLWWGYGFRGRLQTGPMVAMAWIPFAAGVGLGLSLVYGLRG